MLNLWACSLTLEHERFTSFSNYEFFNLKSASKSTGPRAILTTKDKRKRDGDRGIQSTVLLTNQSHAELTLKTHSFPQGDDQTFQPSSLNHVFIYTPDAYINVIFKKKNRFHAVVPMKYLRSFKKFSRTWECFLSCLISGIMLQNVFSMIPLANKYYLN